MLHFTSKKSLNANRVSRAQRFVNTFSFVSQNLLRKVEKTKTLRFTIKKSECEASLDG